MGTVKDQGENNASRYRKALAGDVSVAIEEIEPGKWAEQVHVEHVPDPRIQDPTDAIVRIIREERDVQPQGKSANLHALRKMGP
jgi:hypothetical protein